MTVVQEFDSMENSSQTDDSVSERVYEKDLYKKWFRSKTQSGFISIRPWFAGMKFKIDIGKTGPDGKLISSTNAFVDAVDFAAWLRAVINGSAVKDFPANERTGAVTNESFVSYGGTEVNSKPISRILKIHHWQSGDTYDPSAFVFKAGHFEARKSDTGAFLPNMKAPISVDSIKVTRQELHSISYLVDLSLASHVANKVNWYEA